MALGRVADTSWLYAVFDRDDAHHEAAARELLLPHPTLVPRAIVLETLDLIAYRGSRSAAAAARRDLEAFPHMDLDYPVDHEHALRVWDEHPRLSLHDAHVVACCEATGFPAATFDRPLQRAVAESLARVPQP